jgi:hypothetical protein
VKGDGGEAKTQKILHMSRAGQGEERRWRTGKKPVKASTVLVKKNRRNEARRGKGKKAFLFFPLSFSQPVRIQPSHRLRQERLQGGGEGRVTRKG